MIYSFAGSQFIVIALGLLVVNVTVKVATSTTDVTRLDSSLYQMGLCLFLVPVVWVMIATLLDSCFQLGERVLWVVGFAITASLAVVLSLPLLRLFF